MTYAEKLAFLHNTLAKKMNVEDNCNFYICDFSDDFVIIRDYCEDKYYKINYEIVTDENVCNVTFDIENKVEQIPSFKDLPREFVSINDENKNIDELFAMYNESVEAHNALKEEYEAKTYSVVIDEVEYNVEELNAKYSSDIEALNAQHSEEIDTLNAQYSENVAAKDTEITELSEKLSAKEEECNEIKEQYDNLQKEVEAEKANKLCDEGIALADSEDDLDEDDKECIKEKCSKHEYASISEVEDDIARALYQKKKNNRSKSFKVNTSNSHKENEPKTVFDKL